ncbi:MAG: diphthamide biosynthesis enzyme Dph2 [Candidatus Aenigmarchaeota archaeon]|nr:diphthamide biosynthesis enzyme Dph2 [Candidatus Aenigmarchaeota archaeon]
MRIDTKNIISKLKLLKAKRIMVQFPEGLKMKILEIAKVLEKEGFDLILNVEPVFGACDIRDFEGKRLGCDMILHIGHSDFGVKSELPVIYWDYFFDVNPIPALKKNLEKLNNYKNIGLFTSIQYMPAMLKVKNFLEKNEKNVFTHKSQKYEGQVLGCRIFAATTLKDKIDCFMYIGAGRFHPLGVALTTDIPTFSLDLEKNEIIDFQKEKKTYMKKKAWHDVKLKEARTIGITVSWKQGQNRIEEAMRLKKSLEKEGKEVHILAFDTISKEKIIGMKFDCVVNMVCPRMDDEDLF